LVYHCEQIRVERIAGQGNVVRLKRLALLQRLLAERTADHSEEANPNLADACGMPAFADIINWPVPDMDQGDEDIVTEASFEDAFEAFPALAEDWRMRRRLELGILVKDAISHIDRPADSPWATVQTLNNVARGTRPPRPPAVYANFVDLTRDENEEIAFQDLDAMEPAADLALAIFRRCPCLMAQGWLTIVGPPSDHSFHRHGTEEALLHRCPVAPAMPNDLGILFGIPTPTLEELVRARFNIRPWNAYNNIGISPPDLTAAIMVLRACKKPATATAREMDRLDARFHCMQCTVYEVATVYTWREAVSDFTLNVLPAKYSRCR
jgi:hypothetical protein